MRTYILISLLALVSSTMSFELEQSARRFVTAVDDVTHSLSNVVQNLDFLDIIPKMKNFFQYVGQKVREASKRKDSLIICFVSINASPLFDLRDFATQLVSSIDSLTNRAITGVEKLDFLEIIPKVNKVNDFLEEKRKALANNIRNATPEPRKRFIFRSYKDGKLYYAVY